MDCCIWYSEERPGLTSTVISTALKTRGQSVECIPPQRHSEVDTVSLPASSRHANRNLIKLISCSLVHYLPIHSQIAWKSAYNFWIYSTNKQRKRQHGCEHYPAIVCWRLPLTSWRDKTMFIQPLDIADCMPERVSSLLVSEWVSSCLTTLSTHNRSFWGRSFQAVNCTGTDNIKLETVSIAEPLQNRQHAQNP